ncbi:hypothetical protein [Methanoculleus sp. 10]|nr:hypothetical protein [Methanoculleus sp. 10]
MNYLALIGWGLLPCRGEQDPDLQQKFTHIVDVTAAQGAPVAL